MLKISKLLMVTTIIISISFLQNNLFSKTNYRKIGEIKSINIKKSIVTITGKKIKRKVRKGKKLFIIVNEKPAILKVIKTSRKSAKATILPEYRNNIDSISEGMIVYKYKKGVENRKFVFNLKKEQEIMKNALENKDKDYFKEISSILLKKINTGEKQSYINNISVKIDPQEGISGLKIKIKYISTLLAGFDNPSIEVRKTIYKELLFGQEIKKSGENSFNTAFYILKSIREGKRGNYTIRIIKKKIRRAREKDKQAKSILKKLKNMYKFSVQEAVEYRNYKSLATMSKEGFFMTNYFISSTYLVAVMKKGFLGKNSQEQDIAENTFSLCLNAISFKNGTFKTQECILKDLIKFGKIIKENSLDGNQKAKDVSSSLVSKVKRTIKRVKNKTLKKELKELYKIFGGNIEEI